MQTDVRPKVQAPARADARRAAYPPDHANVRVVPPLVYLAALVAGFALQWFFPVRIAHEEGRELFQLIGGALGMIGVALVGSALGLFRAARTSPIPYHPTKALVVDGPYHFTRNPMYLGMLLVYVGVPLMANAAWPLVFVPVIVAVITRRAIVPEEKYLSRKFGGEYEVYRRQTHRWI